MSEQKPITVLLADDHPHGREGMREIVSGDADFVIVGEAANGEQAVRMAAELVPDLVLMDINMPVMNGMEATQHIKSIDPRIKIIMVTVSDDITDLFESIKRGAQGYLLKNLSPSAWLEYLRAVAVDEAPLSKELAFRMLQEFNGGSRASQAPHQASAGSAAGASEDDTYHTALTQREREVLEGVASGSSNRQIAESFGISEHTVKNHLKNILQKLHLDNRVQLTRYALEKGLIPKK
ncbi:LuxR family two component transcriptional regulator [Paenibacillus taihuensis]|uniref:LuxR family two component transcriptional regulator n=1 Tax=Paenibacillus taihuensis TaxID=1156355 RepID=A0A3D9S049_9BACL|nr:response regulator transcription factor [Paenibacillus taihuensis]REE85098.1 LuxR family two component transcriptional regulator [Paenibacillus taihuensis]